MNLIVVESPTKARTLSRFLGKDYSVEATMGHIKDLPKSRLSVDVGKKFKPNYVVIEKREREIKKLMTEAKKAKEIYLATDPDREGEAIAKHVEEVLRSDLKLKTKDLKLVRIVFHEITKGAVEEAMAHPRKIDRNLVNAQIGRRVLDRLVGYKLSPLLWKKVRRGLSAGRVQTVTVRLIVEREREIEAFKTEEYWEIYCNIKTQKSKIKNNEFIVKLIKIGDKSAKIKDGKTAREIVGELEKAEYSVFDVNKKEVHKRPYPPYTTSTMTQAAARLFYWSSKKTMSIAQSLYEQGLITYHRTDSMSLALGAVEKLRGFISKNYGENYLPEKARFYKTKSKSAQEAHEAIRPTSLDSINNSQLAINNKYIRDAEKLYGLIWKRFVACQMADSVYDQTTIDVQALGNRHEAIKGKFIAYLLRASGQIVKFDGWRTIYDGNSKSEIRNSKQIPSSNVSNSKLNDDEVELPDVSKDDLLQLIKVDPQQKFTQPPARFTEASLIKTLEKLGIGRPSTYAPTISTVLYRNYVEKDESKFKPTSIGIAVNDFLISNFENVFDYAFTAGMEDDLDNVAKGERKWTVMMSEFYKPFEKKLSEVEKEAKRVGIPAEKVGRQCPKCAKSLPAKKRGELVVRVGRFGKFISCSRFPDCDYKEKFLEKIGITCPECLSSGSKQIGDVIIKITRKGRKFYGCSRYPECVYATWRDPKKEDKQ